MTIDLRTRWLGLELDNPFVPSSSPLSKDLGQARQLEDHGAAALVMYSLFEEEIEAEEAMAHDLAEFQAIGHGEASSYLPTHAELPGHRDKYLDQLRQLKDSLDIPVVASLNGTTLGGWVSHARAIEVSERGSLWISTEDRRLLAWPDDPEIWQGRDPATALLGRGQPAFLVAAPARDIGRAQDHGAARCLCCLSRRQAFREFRNTDA